MQIKNYHSESGNVLFLILIAVALFAALSYAVTQSTRSGGGSTDKETNILSAASLTQYPTSLRTSVVRMVLGGTDVDDIEFNAPSVVVSGNEDLSFFHPDGGAALYQLAPADAMAGTSQGAWNFNGHFEIPGIGTDGAGGNDLIAFLPDVGTGICESINDESSFDNTGCDMNGTIPTFDVTAGNAALVTDDQVNGGTSFPSTAAVTFSNASCNVFDSKPAGCFYDVQGSRNVYFSVLLER